MFHSCNFEFKKPPLLKKGVGLKNTYSAIASTPSLDRHKEILVPRGVMTEKFMTNPVMLKIHDHRNVPVGKVTNINVSKEAVQFDFQFADTEEGQQIEKLYNEGFMNAFSVGFIPKNYIDLYDTNDVTSLEVELPNGETEVIDLTKYAEKPYGIISKWELLEISPVPIPANPDALMLRAKDEIIRKFIDAGNSKAAASLLDHQLSERVSELQKELDSFLSKKDSDVVLTYAIPHQSFDTTDEAWDSEDSRAALALWASTDKEHAGEKEFVDWGQFSKGFAWVDLDGADKFVSYRFNHHTVKENALVTVWLGVAESMAKLLTDRSIKEAGAVYAHLAAHYAEFDKTAPAFDRDYTEEELLLISEGKDLPVASADDEVTDDGASNSEGSGSETLSPEEVKAWMELGFAALKAQVVELEDTVRLRMKILGKFLDELHKDVLKIKELPKAEEPKVEESDEAKMLVKELNALSSMFECIHS